MNSREYPKLMIRLPQELKQWIEDRSIRNFRSMNAEVLAILDAVRTGEDDDPAGFRRFARP